MSINNPLLDFSGLPRFDTLRPEHVAPAIQQLILDAREQIADLEASTLAPDWDNFVEPLSAICEHIARAWGVVRHLHSVLDLPPWREAYNAQLAEITRFYAELGQDEALFARYKALAARADFDSWLAARRKVVLDAIRDFRLSGADLPESAKPRFQAIAPDMWDYRTLPGLEQATVPPV